MVDMQNVMNKLAEAIAERRTNPQEDLITFLVDADLDGKRLSDGEVLEIVSLVLQGGVDTTTSLMANALLYLHQDRDARKRLIEQPELRRLACEEFLRFVTPIQTLARTVTTATELGGCQLQKGDRVLIAWAGANRDEKVFERPDDVILDRYPNRHLAFGVGIHRCIGSNLARAQFLAVLDAVLARLPDYDVIEEEVRRYPAIGMIHRHDHPPGHVHPRREDRSVDLRIAPPGFERRRTSPDHSPRHSTTLMAPSGTCQSSSANRGLQLRRYDFVVHIRVAVFLAQVEYLGDHHVAQGVSLALVGVDIDTHRKSPTPGAAVA